MDEIFNRIKTFVIAKRWAYDFPLTRETTLQKDLKIYGDDADEFIIAFGKEFNVDTSQFRIRDYFESEGDPIALSVLRFF